MVAGNSNPYSIVSLKYGNNATDTVTGIVIYPDDFSFADAGVGAMTFGISSPTAIDIDSWRALENAGCVFLPKNREITSTLDEGSYGLHCGYWGATTANQWGAHNIYIAATRLNAPGLDNRYYRYNVRLVQDL